MMEFNPIENQEREMKNQGNRISFRKLPNGKAAFALTTLFFVLNLLLLPCSLPG
jgi:hypothetical protein